MAPTISSHNIFLRQEQREDITKTREPTKLINRTLKSLISEDENQIKSTSTITGCDIINFSISSLMYHLCMDEFFCFSFIKPHEIIIIFAS